MTIERNREEILRIAARHSARNVACLVRSHEEFEELLQRKVDVLTDASIYPAIRQRITAEARAL
jgi:predicted nucleotidyltransferase